MAAVGEGGHAAYVGLPMEALIAPWRNLRVAQQQFADQNTMGMAAALATTTTMTSRYSYYPG